MRKFYIAVISSLLVCNAYSQTQPLMFRGSPQHTASMTSKNNFVFADEAWKFNVKAPVRSTAVCNNNNIFFGSSKGIFYSLDKSNGNIKWQFNTGYCH